MAAYDSPCSSKTSRGATNTCKRLNECRLQAIQILNVPVYVFFGVIRRIILYDPIDGWDVQASGCHISTEQDAGLSLTELKEGGRPFLLLLLAM